MKKSICLNSGRFISLNANKKLTLNIIVSLFAYWEEKSHVLGNQQTSIGSNNTTAIKYILFPFNSAFLSKAFCCVFLLE